MTNPPGSPPVTVRGATPADLETIARFQIGLARETEDLDLDPPTLRLGIAKVLADPSLGRYFLAEAEGDPVGSLMITYEWSDSRNRMVWWIQSVWVEEAYRRRGIYSSLYHHVRSLPEADPHVGGIRLYVEQRNTRAQDVYRRLGMNGDHYTTFEWM